MNTLRSFTETVVTTPTDTFPISFEYDEKYDAVHVFLNDVAVEDLGYTVSQVNAVTLKVEPAILEGTVRIERETDIDKTYSMPKSCVSYRKPRKLNDKYRELKRVQMKQYNTQREIVEKKCVQ